MQPYNDMKDASLYTLGKIVYAGMDAQAPIQSYNALAELIQRCSDLELAKENLEVSLIEASELT